MLDTMKRVQAIVSGRKKQCTKLPTPAQKGSSKKSPSTPETVPTGSPLSASGKDTNPKDGARRGSKNAAPASPATPPDTRASISSASSTITAGSRSSSLSTISASSSVRGTSKIPASTPKKGSKDGGRSTSPNKGRLRLDSDGKSKSKQAKSEQSSSRRSSKDKHKGDKGKPPETPQRTSSIQSAQEPKDDQGGFVRQNVYAEENRDASAVTSQPSGSDKAQAAGATAAVAAAAGAAALHGQGHSRGVENRDARDAQFDPRYHGDARMMSSEQMHHHDGQRSGLPPQGQGQGHQGHYQGQGQGHPPLHGILKDSNGSMHNKSHYYQAANEIYNNGANGQHYGRLGRAPSRTHSARGSSDFVYQQGYGSLPRSSRSTTPTQENVYSYGSLPRRSNASTPTQNPMYFSNGSNQGWGSLARRAESDSGFAMGSMDRAYNNHTYAVINHRQKSSNGTYGVVGYSNQNYGVVNHNYQPPRPGSVPPPGSDSPESVYSVARPGSVPPHHYYSDTESGAYHRGVRAGSVPLGYESESGVYGVPPRHGSVPRNYESESEYGNGSSSSLRVRPGDEQYRAGPGKRPIPRRHTVGAPNNKDQETERKREAFMQLLAQRYPQYADKIQSAGGSPTPQNQPVDKPARTRDVQRRRTAVVNYDPNQAGHTLEYDDLGTMSDLELPSFQRGGFMRTSLPIVRSASTSLERPLGLVFLVYGDQTKKSLLPNEITTLDTVRALFVRAFPDLTLEMLESPRKKIYLLDPATNIYFQLEDLAEIKDRSVLKIHETDSDEPQKVKERQEVRGRTVQMPASRPHPRQAYGELPIGHGEMFTKSQSLPPQSAHNYPEMMQDQRNQWEMERRSRSRTPEPAERPRSLSAGAATRQRFSHSPDRLPTPERGPLNPIPENRQLPPGYREPANYYEAVAPGGYRGQYSSGVYEAPASYQGYPPASPNMQQAYVARSTRATPMAHPQRAVAPGPDMRDGGRGNNSNRHSLAFAPISMAQGAPPEGGYQRSQSYRIPPSEREGTEVARSHSVTPADDTTRWSRNRIEKMEQQLANLTAWVHYQKSDGTRRDQTPPPRSLGSTTSDSSDTFPASSASKHKGETPSLSTIATSTNHVVVPSQGLSDIPDGHYSAQRSSGLSSRESTPLSAQAEASAKVAQLKSDLHILRRQQQLNMEAMRDEFMAAFNKVKKVLSSVPGAENQVNFHKRTEATTAKNNYLGDKQQADKELSDLEASVEELRTDVISRQCRVNTADVEGMALLLSNVTKALADLKARFPEIQAQMKNVMDSEMRLVVAEEKFLKEEPTEIENSLKRCKKLTGTLYTLKRLASVQDHRPPQVPTMTQASDAPLSDQKNALLENIRALVPDHDQRVMHMEAADASRERKKKISSQQEALKFGKSLEMASKNLRPPSANGDRIDSAEGAGDDENKVARKNSDGLAGGLVSQSKPSVPAKPVISSAAASAVTVSSAPITTMVTAIPASNVASVKPSFSAALTTAKSSTDKPTATVSAMTAGVSDTVTTTAMKAPEKEPSKPMMKNVTIPLTQTTGSMASTVKGGTGTVTQTVKVGTESPKRKDASIYTYQVCGPVNPVIPVPPPEYNQPEKLDGYKPPSPSELKEKQAGGHSEKSNSNFARPSDFAQSKNDTPKKGSVSFSNPPVTYAGSADTGSPVNGHADKGDLATQKQAARNAFFSSMNSPPTSPSVSSPKRDSASLDPGPVVSPGVVGTVTPGPTINLVLSGTASPKSPTSPGSFTITPPSEIKSPPPTEPKTSTSSINSPTRGIPRFVPDSKSPPYDSQISTGSQGDAGSKQKKVPPPPPPRKGSRPISANISPVNGGALDSSTQQSQDTPRFVGGILGQHRLSGGPLSSTPKSAAQQKPMSKFEKDIASGIYANMNRPDVQSQKNSPQQMISEANAPGSSSSSSANPMSHSNSSDEGPPIPPPPAVTIRALEREERGSSSESTSSSSGTSMGSQQSVINVVRSASVNVKSPSKPKPDPPKRQSSLLSKLTGGKDSKSKINNGKAKVNGVDL